MSRPEKPIDWDKVDELLMADCHGTEICPYFDMHPKTFYRRVEEKYGVSFTEYSQEKKRQGDSCLRYKQYLKAMGVDKDGDNTLLIWLGKCRLKQSENESSDIPKIQPHLDSSHEIMRLKAELAELKSKNNINDN